MHKRCSSLVLSYGAAALLLGMTLLLVLSLPVADARGRVAQDSAATLELGVEALEPALLAVAPLGDANLIGDNFPIATAANYQSSPAVIGNAAGNEYLVVWHDSRSGSYDDIYGQRVDGSGALLGGNFAIATATNNQSGPAAAWNTMTNQYLVVWGDSRSNSYSSDIYGQRVGASGVLLGGNFAITTAANAQGQVAIVWNATANEYLVVWHDRRNNAYAGDIWGQRVEANGELLGGDFAIATAANHQSVPAVAWNATTNEYLVVWMDERSGPYKGDIYGQRVGGNGSLAGVNFPIATSAANELYPNLAWNAAANEYLVVWGETSGGPGKVYGQWVGGSGALQGGSFAIATAEYNQEYPKVAWNAMANEYLVVWQDQRNDPYERDIYGQRISGSGSLTGGSFPVATAATSELYPAVAWNAAANTYLVVWADSRLGLLDIYGQQVVGVAPIPTPTAPATATNTPTRTPMATPTSTATRTATPTRTRLYLPLVLRRWPPIADAPVLNAIAPPGASPSYTVSWNAAYLADSYILEQATSASFSDTTQVYAGASTSTIIPSQGIATYHYRVKAHNSYGDSPWSNVQAVEVRWEREPNYPSALANGPLVSGLDYYGYPNDAQDYFTFQTARREQITIDLTNHTGQGVQLVLYYPRDVEVARVFAAPYHLVFTGDPGAYYVQIYSTGGHNSATPYTLRATFP